ncbi:tRNA processing endoribonuclease [Phlyctema vagabunda]|uniref:tRNA processing endoribonuclease n=1 Tax=Phlyctema vagabunda TaxID=108571 RepID=A0ABR4PP29_9HELO
MDAESSTTAAARPTPAHKACVHCRSRKVRCLPGPEATACQRCHRLQIACEVPAPVRRARDTKCGLCAGYSCCLALKTKLYLISLG